MYNVIHLTKIDSTNTELKRRAVLGAASGTVLVADLQTAGRGRLGRDFFSPEGSGLYMSLLLRPVRLTDAGLLTTFCAVAVARALRIFGVDAGIKWVNDLIVGGRKLCGILAESGTFNGEPFAILGIGVNLKKTAFPESLAPIAVSIEELTGTAPDRDELLAAILTELDRIRVSSPQNPQALMNEYRARSITLGKNVRVIPHRGTPFDAFAEAISDDGSLLVRTPDGTSFTVSSGEVSVRGGVH